MCWWSPLRRCSAAISGLSSSHSSSLTAVKYILKCVTSSCSHQPTDFFKMWLQLLCGQTTPAAPLIVIFNHTLMILWLILINSLIRSVWITGFYWIRWSRTVCCFVLDLFQGRMSPIKMKGGIKDLATPPASHLAGLPRGKKNTHSISYHGEWIHKVSSTMEAVWCGCRGECRKRDKRVNFWRNAGWCHDAVANHISWLSDSD